MISEDLLSHTTKLLLFKNMIILVVSKYILVVYKKKVSEVGFEPTPTRVDCDLKKKSVRSGI